MCVWILIVTVARAMRGWGRGVSSEYGDPHGAARGIVPHRKN